MAARIIFAIFFLALNGQALQAAYLTKVPQTVHQPDGSILSCFASGDEYHNWLHDANDFTIIQNPQTGYYVYADKSDGKLVPTTLIAGRADPAASGLKPGLNLDPVEIMRLKGRRFSLNPLKAGYSPGTTGTINNIVIFVRFSDQPEFTNPPDTYSIAFNAAGTVSVGEYFQEVSGRQLAVHTSFFPSATGPTVVSYQDSHPRNYYCRYNQTTNIIGYQSEAESLEREMQLLKDAAESVASEIAATGLNFDIDNNGLIDNVCYIVQGAVEGWSDLLWPHMWELYTHDVRISGLRLWSFNLQLSRSFGVSVLCHEMAHTLGFPDLYRYTDKSINPVGPWDVMATTTTPPQHPGAYMKVKYGRWRTSMTEINDPGTYRLSILPLSADPFSGIKVRSPESADEYFVIEYRKREGRFEPGVPGSGLIIYRVKPDLRGNSDGPPDEVYVFRQGNADGVNGDIRSASFSLESGRTSFTATSNPPCLLSDGQPGGIEVIDIGSAGDSISFTLNVGPTTPILLVSPDSCHIPFTGGNAIISVTNDGIGSMVWNATVSPGASWLQISSGNSGVNAGTVEVTARINPLNEVRTGIINIISDGVPGSPQTVMIAQAANPPVLNVLPATRNVGSGGGIITFDVSNTGGGKLAWKASISDGDSWIRLITGASGTNTGTIKLLVSENVDSPTRTGTISISDTTGVAVPVTVQIIQASLNPVLSVLPAIRHVGPEAGTTGFQVANTGGGLMNWSVMFASVDNWLRMTSPLSGTNTDSIWFAYDANPDRTDRTGVITIEAGSAAFSPVTVFVIQAGASAGITDQPAENGFSVYPNPFKNRITIDLPELPRPGTTLEILNSSGQAVSTQKLILKTTVLDQGKLAPGVWYLLIKSENQKPWLRKVVKD